MAGRVDEWLHRNVIVVVGILMFGYTFGGPLLGQPSRLNTSMPSALSKWFDSMSFMMNTQGLHFHSKPPEFSPLCSHKIVEVILATTVGLECQQKRYVVMSEFFDHIITGLASTAFHLDSFVCVTHHISILIERS